jgi:hypothetical protein
MLCIYAKSLLKPVFLMQTARSGDPHTHIIQRVEPTHEGLYTCVAGNGKIFPKILYKLDIRPGTHILQRALQIHGRKWQEVP